MSFPVFLGLAFALGVVGFVGGFMVASALLGWHTHRVVSPIWYTPTNADNADKKIVRLRKRAWRGRPFRVNSPVPDDPAQQAPHGAKEVRE